MGGWYYIPGVGWGEHGEREGEGGEGDRSVSASKEERLKAARAELAEARRARDEAVRVWDKAGRALTEADRVWDATCRKVRAIEEEL